MNTISELMTHDHRDCDGIFARAEELASDGDWADAAEALKKFADALNAHFDAEESTLFPAFEQATGNAMGPTRVMRLEHQQMRETLAGMDHALAGGDLDDFLGQAEGLLILMQQHNIKEEQMLYPMCDRLLSGTVGSVIQAMRDVPAVQPT